MYYLSLILAAVLFAYPSQGECESDFGYICYHTFNIGDDFQAIAAQRFLPKNAIGIDREFIGTFEHPVPLPTIVNGWYMHSGDFYWYRSDVPAPAKSWPPAPSIDPLFISLHLAEGFLPYAFSSDAVTYLKAHAPIGARDFNTLQELEARGIPSYFSGCLCLTMENDAEERKEIIYAVDLDDECLEYLKSNTSFPVETLCHNIDPQSILNEEFRQQFAEEILDKYKRAKAVVTVRLHATMPCLAFETPVLLINSSSDKRLHGLRELSHHCDREEFLSGQFHFDFDAPPANPIDYLELRQDLIETVSNWVKMHQLDFAKFPARVS